MPAQIIENSAVSVIVAVRNGAQFLAQALASIAAQTLPPAEVVIIDGHSTDDTPHIAQSWRDAQGRAAHYVRQTGRSVADAYNLGLATAQHQLIAFLSHDDLWLPDKLAQQVAFLAANPDAAGVVCHVEFFLTAPDAILPEGARREWLNGARPAWIMETLLARRMAFERIGGFAESLTPADDVDWFARARDAGLQIPALPAVLTRKRLHNNNTSLSDPHNNRNLLHAMRQSIKRKRIINGEKSPQMNADGH